MSLCVKSLECYGALLVQVEYASRQGNKERSRLLQGNAARDSTTARHREHICCLSFSFFTGAICCAVGLRVLHWFELCQLPLYVNCRPQDQKTTFASDIKFKQEQVPGEPDPEPDMRDDDDENKSNDEL